MKKTRKLAAILLAFVLILSMTVPTLAEGTGGSGGNHTNSTTGSITIDQAVSGQTYSLYRIFNLESYNKKENAYLYKVNDAWKEFINQPSVSGTDGYVAIDAVTGLVSWAKKDDKGNKIGQEEFARLALAYAKDANHKIDPVTSASSHTVGDPSVTVTKNQSDDTYTITFSELDLGYYLVDSSLGALCALDTTNPGVTVKEKNGQPTVKKEVEEGGKYGGEASAQIGATVTFRTTITAQAGAENYVLHDKMSEGLAFKEITGVTKISDGNKTTLGKGTDYTLASENLGDKCSFELTLTDAACKALKAGDTIVVTYTAVLTADAVISGTGNPNETFLKYGDNNTTVPGTAVVYTYRFQLVKTDQGSVPEGGTDTVYNVLSGAKFRLYDQESGGTPIKFVKEADGSYRVALTTEKNTVEEMEAGTPLIKGLDKNTYWLEETKAPDGFNKLPGRISVDLSGGDNVVGENVLDTVNHTYIPVTGISGGVQVENRAGSMLPSTGGIGTTIFYVLGGILVIGAAVLWAVRRRPGAEK